MSARTRAAAIAPSEAQNKIDSNSRWKKLWMTVFQGTAKRPDCFMF